MDDVGNGVNLRQAASTKLDYIGQVKSHSYFVNDPDCLQRLREKAELALSIGLIDEFQALEKQSKINVENVVLSLILGDAICVYRNGETNKKGFLKNHIKAMLVLVFNDTTKGKNQDILDWLELLDAADQEGKLDKELSKASSTPPVIGSALPLLAKAASTAQPALSLLAESTTALPPALSLTPTHIDAYGISEQHLPPNMAAI